VAFTAVEVKKFTPWSWFQGVSAAVEAGAIDNTTHKNHSSNLPAKGIAATQRLRFATSGRGIEGVKRMGTRPNILIEKPSS
jgi:hypothetical protein